MLYFFSEPLPLPSQVYYTKDGYGRVIPFNIGSGDTEDGFLICGVMEIWESDSKDVLLCGGVARHKSDLALSRKEAEEKTDGKYYLHQKYHHA
jgi:hypothetical protein